METTQVAVWPLDEDNGVGDEELGRLLLSRARDRETRLTELEARHQRLGTDIERERQHIEHLRALLRDMGLASPPSPVPPTPTPNGTQPNRPANTDFSTGNRSPKLPERRPEFASVSLVEAAGRILRRDDWMRTDDVAREIFDVQTAEQLRAANGTLRSVLASGVKRGAWERGDTPGMFRIAGDGAGETEM